MLLALACSAPPEVDVPFHAPATALPHGLELGGQALTLGAEVLASNLYEPPVVQGNTVLVAHEHEGSGRILRLDWTERWASTVLLDAGGRPDRLSLSPDKEVVAFVWGKSGVASVWTLQGAEAPVQRTNVALTYAPGRPPAGFVPPPTVAPRFEGARLTWPGAPELTWR